MEAAEKGDVSATAEGLWARVLAEIGRRGLLPLRSEPLTPREIAEYFLAQVGDRTVHRFVHEYLYPTKFGQTKGLMSDREAETLIAGFERGKRTPDPAEPTPAEVPKCRVCHHRPVSDLSE
jgi:hypothetical protein